MAQRSNELIEPIFLQRLAELGGIAASAMVPEQKKRPPFRVGVGPEMRSPGELILSYLNQTYLSRGISNQ